ncbi:endo-1,4-beta-xylanase 5 [Eucalyptus grandis]|uniref:endo-1,4-beta-xylanase 5 n=1 Tax=Eucalyptus grandis TaxID=71139 RepID=UPI00192E9310|nr:endo-1,4-beta-xylanase 5 [Eucalyptus grandis]
MGFWRCDSAMSGLAYALMIWATILSGFGANALKYDYTASIECLPFPQKPQYNGGIIKNPELNFGLRAWSTFGIAKVEHRVSNGNKFIVAYSRNDSHDSISQKIYLNKDKLYTFSAWVQVSDGKIPVQAIFKTTRGFKHAGAVIAESNCWSMIKGGLTVDESGPAELYFESKNTSVEIWVDSISLQPFTTEEWRSHHEQSIEEKRKRKVRIHVMDKQDKPLANATISIVQKKLSFPFGSATNKNILTNSAYQNWFTSRFTVTTFEDEMKWYTTEPSQGREDYSAADALLKFAQQHGISVRGHNVLWDDPRYQPSWVPSLSASQLSKAVANRIISIIKRYKGQVIGWDVVNENLHFSFFESKLGPQASANAYKTAKFIDPSTTLFLNEYNTIEDSRDRTSSPTAYANKVKSIQSLGGRNLGIGLESHFNVPDLPYMRSAIDTLGALGLPMWLTEVDVQSGPNQAMYLEQVLREAHAHPKINGIVMWTAWKPEGCYRMCLTDNNFRNLPTGDVVDKLLKEWGGGRQELSGMTSPDGTLEASLFHGDYQVTVAQPGANNSYVVQSLEVAPAETSPHRFILRV